MGRTIATVGVLGLALLGTSASANAAPPSGATAFHAAGPATTLYLAHTVAMPYGENLTDENLAPAGDKADGTGKADGTDKSDGTGKADGTDKSDDCQKSEKPEKPPVEKPEKPPVEKPEKPPVEKPEKPPVEQPPVEAPAVPPVETPVVLPVAVPEKPSVGAARAVPAPVVNVGFNVQTAAGGSPDAGIPLWLSVLTGLFTAGAATALCRGWARRRNAEG